MGKQHSIPPFAASISKQGNDRHLHIPRRMYPMLEEEGLLNKKLRVRLVLEEMDKKNLASTF